MNKSSTSANFGFLSPSFHGWWNHSKHYSILRSVNLIFCFSVYFLFGSFILFFINNEFSSILKDLSNVKWLIFTFTLSARFWRRKIHFIRVKISWWNLDNPFWWVYKKRMMFYIYFKILYAKNSLKIKYKQNNVSFFSS